MYTAAMIGIREYSDHVHELDRGDRDFFQDQNKNEKVPAAAPNPVPNVYYWDPNENTQPPSPPPPTPHSRSTRTTRTPMPRTRELEDVVKCPICDDPVIEAAVSACGHTFCHDCIHEWKKVKSWCPICQELLESVMGGSKLHRVYAIDNITENHLGEYPLEIQQRFLRRRALREAAAKKELKSKHPAKYVRGIAREYRLYFQAKGRFGGICHAVAALWNGLATWISRLPFPISVALLLIFAYSLGRCSCQLNPFHFIAYLWEAIQKYPGTQPPLPPPPATAVPTPTSNPDPSCNQPGPLGEIFNLLYSSMFSSGKQCQ